MARKQPPLSATDDVPEDVRVFEHFTVYRVTAPGTGTPNVQISPDGTNWFTVGPFNANGYLTVTDDCAYMRVHGGSGTAGAYQIVGIYSHDGG